MVITFDAQDNLTLKLRYPYVPIAYACRIQNATYDFQAANGNNIKQKEYVHTQPHDVGGCCIEVDNKLAGGVLFYVHNDWAFITCGHVFLEYRGKHYYSMIMKYIEEWARDNRLSGIFVSTYEFEAPHIYEHLGFTKGSVLKNIPKGNMSIDYYKHLDEHNGN